MIDGGAHSDNEWVDVDTIEPHIDCMCDFMLEKSISRSGQMECVGPPESLVKRAFARFGGGIRRKDGVKNDESMGKLVRFCRATESALSTAADGRKVEK